MDSYIYIPVVALCCYTFLLLSFMAAKKNKLIYAFLLFLGAMILWTGGSLCMRMQIGPSIPFWYNLSVLGLTLMPYAFFRYIVEFIGAKDQVFKRIYLLIIAVINIVNITTGFILAPPEVIDIKSGELNFVYDTTWAISILFLVCVLITVHSLFLLYRYIKKNDAAKKQFRPIIIGVFIVMAGHLGLFVPFLKGFPTDILGGICFSGFLFYALYNRNLFKLTLLVSRGSCYGMAAGVSLLLFSNLIGLFQNFIDLNLSRFKDHSVLIIAVFFTFATFAIYLVMKKFIDKVFTKDEIHYAENLKNFSSKVSKSLDVNTILEELTEVVQETIQTQKVYICIRNEKDNIFEMIHSTSPLDKKYLTITEDNPMITWLAENEGCLQMREFRRSIIYKSMWEEEKKVLEDLKIECIVGLKDEEDLEGIILLTGKENRKPYSFNDINFLASVDSVGSIAVKNSKLYEKAFMEARMDDLTGLLNRKYFYKTIKAEFEKNKEQSLALVILSIDDFKLYNQLYGNREGDIALQKIARIMKASVGGNGCVARYNGKEFAMILPRYDLLRAKNLADNISRQITELNQNEAEYRLKTLTVSGGICAVPYAASSVKELIDNVERAIYHVKRQGKNAIMIYSERDSKLVPGNFDVDLKLKENIYSDYEKTIYALTAAIDTKDHYTFDHSNNVAYYAVKLAYVYGMNREAVEIIKEAALLHDIGKIGIPEQILNKPDKLTDEEYEVMKKHVENSIDIIRHLPSLDYVIPAVIGHHERYDGQGYPRGLSKEDIPVSARILCIVDSFDAMISARSYKKAYLVKHALRVIEEEAGRQFDPELAQIFVESVRNGSIEVRNSVEHVS